jgi:hypothetical protein
MHTPTKLELSTCLILASLLSACTILGVEPDEIDVADETGTNNGSTNGEGMDEGVSDTGEEDPSTSGDGDGDDGQDAGDGDGDEASGDGDGDGDGDGGGDGDGDGDGESDTGDGDGDAETLCATYDPIVLGVGENPVEIPDVSSFEGSCGAPGPDEVFSFPAPSDGSYEFTLASDAFDGVLYLVGENCVPLDEIACKVEGEAIEHDMAEGEVVFIIVDSDADPGTATVTIAEI